MKKRTAEQSLTSFPALNSPGCCRKNGSIQHRHSGGMAGFVRGSCPARWCSGERSGTAMRHRSRERERQQERGEVNAEAFTSVPPMRQPTMVQAGVPAGDRHPRGMQRWSDGHGATTHAHDRWRTPELKLQFVGLFGGWPGALFAQEAFRHKVSKSEFQILFWFAVTLNCAGLAWLLSSGHMETIDRAMVEVVTADYSHVVPEVNFPRDQEINVRITPLSQ